MIIGVDAGALSITDDRLKVGVYRVIKNALAALALIDKKNNYRLYTFGPIEEGIVQAFDGRAETVRLARPGWQRIWLPIELKKRPVDAFLGFAQSLPSVRTLCDVGFVYDLGFLYRPDVYGASAAILIKQTDQLVRRADHLIAISQATKADILATYGLSAQNITVAYPGVERIFSPVGEKHKGIRPYFLFVGSLNRAKDIPRLIGEFAQFCRRNTTHELILVGGEYWPDLGIEKAIETFHLAGRVKKIGVVTDKELASYYRGACAFVTTALREGFCLPAAEAMASGTPVVALGQGALKEIVGEGGILVNPISNSKYQISDFAEAMVKMTDTKTRDMFVQKAIIQASKFTWEKFGRQIFYEYKTH